MTGADKPSLRERLHPLMGGSPGDLMQNLVAGRLLREGTEMWSRNPHSVQEATDKVERAWALTRDPRTAIQLATMYDKANRNDDALVLLRAAVHDHPRDAVLRHHAGITLLRHGAPDDIRDFFEGVLAIDADDAFARFVVTLLDRYDGWASDLAASIERQRDARQPFIISLPVWGATYSGYCVRYMCATLLSPNNLPALAKDHSVHLSIFTTEETEKALRADPLFARVADHAAIHFAHYTADQVNYKASMAACYGDIDVFYSSDKLAFFYERNCKFALMSCAHYVAMAAARATDAYVSCLVADIVMNDGAMPSIAACMKSADAVLAHTVQMHGRVLRPALEEFRGADGVLQIPVGRCAELIVENIPEGNLADAERCMDPPLRIAWRVGEGGLLIHGNHYHPFCLRPKAFAHPLRLSIDPVDSRFIERTSLEMNRIHLVADASINIFSIDDDPILEPSENSMGRLSVPLFGLWLWGYWGRLRGALFRAPVRIGPLANREAWERAEKIAAETVDAIVAYAARLDDGNRARRSWRL